MRRTTNEGFTLIEMLITIGIVGVLTSLLIATVNDARGKGAAVRVKASVQQLRTIAELYHNRNSDSYTGFSDCIDTPNTATCLDNQRAAAIQVLKLEIEGANGQSGSITATSGPDGFCIVTPLEPLPDVAKFCVDGSGEYEQNDAGACGVVGGNPGCVTS